MDLVNWDQVLDSVLNFGLLLAKAIVVFFVLRLVARMILGIFVKLLERRHTDDMLIRFAASIGNAFLLLIVVIASLNVLGVDTTSLIAIGCT